MKSQFLREVDHKLTRREALRDVAAVATVMGAVGGVGPRSCRATPKGYSGLQGVELAIATICVDGFVNKRHEPAFAEIPKLGYKNVEFNLWFPDVISPSYFDDLRQRCEATGLTPISVQGNSIGFVGPDGLVKDVAHKLLLIEGCRRLGCRIVKCTGLRRNVGAGVEAIIQTLREIVPILEQRGVLFVLENHAGNALERPDDFAAVFKAIDSPNVGMCLDTGHFEGVGVDLHAVVDEFAERILHVDLKDCRARGEGHDTVVFGQGATDFDAFLGHVMQTNYAGYLVIEQAWNVPRGDWRADLAAARERFQAWERPE